MHIKDEGLDPGELIVDYYSFDNQNWFLYPVVASAVEPLKDGTYVNVGGDKYMGVYSGCSLSVFPAISELKSYLDALSSNGQQDAISAIYLVPDFCVQNRVKKDNGWGYWVDASAGTPTEDYWWYCDLRRYGSCRHAGFGLGFERMVMSFRNTR